MVSLAPCSRTAQSAESIALCLAPFSSDYFSDFGQIASKADPVRYSLLTLPKVLQTEVVIIQVK
jgi:hypothetical protein